jgi:hypothetical protein
VWFFLNNTIMTIALSLWHFSTQIFQTSYLSYLRMWDHTSCFIFFTIDQYFIMIMCKLALSSSLVCLYNDVWKKIVMKMLFWPRVQNIDWLLLCGAVIYTFIRPFIIALTFNPLTFRMWIKPPELTWLSIEMIEAYVLQTYCSGV